MCGIVGFCDFSKKTSYEILQSMTNAISYRGPDDSGYSYNKVENATIGLGHRRLSVIDLSSNGHQPMEFKNLEIIYNGEVYNFKEIRLELEKLNYLFESNSDTEVILKAYHAWGIKSVHKFNGMFSIVIYDRVKKDLTLIRDRSGIKPYYWYWDGELFLFGSELKSFHKHPNFKKNIDLSALASYLQYGYISQPYSIFNSCHKLQSGHYLKIDIDSKRFEEKEYWDVGTFYQKPKLEISDTKAIEKVESLLQSSFEYRMVADVPVGVFLSGGYDSSIVTALLQSNRDRKINTFSIGFEEKGFDEAPYAKAVAKELGTEHTEYYCKQKDALDIFPKLVDIYDEPFGDSSAIPTILVSQLAKKKVTVSLSADGADEIFAGYTKYETALNFYNKIHRVPLPMQKIISSNMNKIDPKNIPLGSYIQNFDTRYEKMKNSLNVKNCSTILKYKYQKITQSELNKLFLNPINSIDTPYDIDTNIYTKDNIDQMLIVDYKSYMNDDIFTKVDRATMSTSLEGREPFLDYRLIEFVAQLPSHMKIRNGEKKWILKEITHKYLPKKIMERPKRGFAVPLQTWFKDEFKEYLFIYLSEKRLKEEGIFNVQEVIKMRDRYLSGDDFLITRIWFILIFEMWYEKWM
jgi:asparagine synthase (glutamine-hydrolysing)